MIDISGLDKRAVFHALYRRAKPQGMGFLHYRPGDLTEAELDLAMKDNDSLYFDYVKGRVMKVRLAEDEFDEFCYDRDNGTGAAQGVINDLRLFLKTKKK